MLAKGVCVSVWALFLVLLRSLEKKQTKFNLKRKSVVSYVSFNLEA